MAAFPTSSSVYLRIYSKLSRMTDFTGKARNNPGSNTEAEKRMRFIKAPRVRGFTLSVPIAASVHGWSKGRCAAISCLLKTMSKLECTASRIAGDVSRRKRKRSKEAPLENARRKLKMWKRETERVNVKNGLDTLAGD
jgi:hypothetical protein